MFDKPCIPMKHRGGTSVTDFWEPPALRQPTTDGEGYIPSPWAGPPLDPGISAQSSSLRACAKKLCGASRDPGSTLTNVKTHRPRRAPNWVPAGILTAGFVRHEIVYEA
jgi:hypothetical protein